VSTEWLDRTWRQWGAVQNARSTGTVSDFTNELACQRQGVVAQVQGFSDSRDSGVPGIAGYFPEPVGRLKPRGLGRDSWLEAPFRSTRVERLVRIAANLVGAAGAAFFAQATLQAILSTHRLIGVAFFAEQMWVVVAYLIRRPARIVSRRLDD